MERPPADPVKLLAKWMEWEKGEVMPGRLLADLKTAGMRDVLEHLAASAAEAEAATGPAVADVTAL
jgi:hypothetical protein